MRQVCLRLGPALRADLDRDVVRFRGGDHRLALLDGAAGRLFDVHVLAAFGGVDRLDRVPVVRRGDHDGVDVFALEDVAVIVIGLHARPGGFQGVGQTLLVDIAHRGDINLSLITAPYHIAEVAPAHAPDTDMRGGDFFIAPGSAPGGQDAGGDEIGNAGRDGRGRQKFTSAEWMGRFHRCITFLLV